MEIEKRPFHFETTKGSAKMTMIQALLDEPKEKNWLYPKICRALYILSMCGVLLHSVAILIVMISDKSLRDNADPVGNLLIIGKALLLSFGILIIGLLLSRMLYELAILIYKIFQSIRELITSTENIGRKIDKMYDIQLQTGQYVCDSLATLCDNSQGDK